MNIPVIQIQKTVIIIKNIYQQTVKSQKNIKIKTKQMSASIKIKFSLVNSQLSTLMFFMCVCIISHHNVMMVQCDQMKKVSFQAIYVAADSAQKLDFGNIGNSVAADKSNINGVAKDGDNVNSNLKISSDLLNLLKMDIYCKTVADQNICKQCYTGYFVNPQTNRCKKLNPLCRQSNLKNGQCLSCYQGYSLNSLTGTCQLFISDPNCKKYQNNRCLQCATRYFYDQISSKSKCTPVSILCETYDINNGNCLSCYPGYTVKNGQCVVYQSVYTKNCRIYNKNSNKCEQCFGGYYIDQADTKCKQANPLCKNYNMIGGACLNCYQGYQLDNSNTNCIVNTYSDKNCKKSSNIYNKNQCDECYTGFIVIDGKCQNQNPLCKTVDKNGACLSCWAGYQLSNGNCTVVEVRDQQQPSDINCIKYTDDNSNGQCCECSSGYYLNKNSKKCEQVDYLCQTYDQNYGFCLSCYGGYTLNSDNRCIFADTVQIAYCQTTTVDQNNATICTKCIQRYFLQNNTCNLVSLLCSSYNKITGKCTACLPGYILENGDCIFPAIFDSNCIKYQSAYCSKCKNGFYLKNYACQPIDRNCFRFDEEMMQCDQCVNGLEIKNGICSY